MRVQLFTEDGKPLSALHDPEGFDAMTGRGAVWAAPLPPNQQWALDWIAGQTGPTRGQCDRVGITRHTMHALELAGLIHWARRTGCYTVTETGRKACTP